jgi:pimeloyl-ACP methyl ester carboxylesterase
VRFGECLLLVECKYRKQQRESENEYMKKKVKKMMLYCLAFLIFTFAIGFCYQGYSAWKDAKKYSSAFGKTYEVYGGNMHIYTGGEGDNTVVFNAGSGTANPYVDFYPLYEKLEKETKYAVIDRFGYGYSDTTDRKRDVDNIVEETRQLLKESGLKPPYIMVGHSLASLETIRYAQKYPDEVSGIVLVDAGNPEYYSNLKPPAFISPLTWFLRTSGAFRVATHINENFLYGKRNNLEYVPADLREIDLAFHLMKLGNKNITGELQQLDQNVQKVLEEKSLDVPLTVLTADSFGSADQYWLDTQAELATWSSLGKHIVVKDSNHYIHQYQPDFVSEEIISLLKKSLNKFGGNQ